MRCVTTISSVALAGVLAACGGGTHSRLSARPDTLPASITVAQAARLYLVEAKGTNDQQGRLNGVLAVKPVDLAKARLIAGRLADALRSFSLLVGVTPWPGAAARDAPVLRTVIDSEAALATHMAAARSSTELNADLRDYIAENQAGYPAVDMMRHDLGLPGAS